MKIKVFVLLAALAGAGSGLSAQQILSPSNPFSRAQLSAEGFTEEQLSVLVDGNDYTTLTVEDGTSFEMEFIMPELWYAKGFNIVCGKDTDKAPNKVTLYGYDVDLDSWRSIITISRGMSYENGYSNFIGRSGTSTVKYSRFKFTVESIQASTALELSEIELIGLPVESRNAATEENGSWTACEAANGLDVLNTGSTVSINGVMKGDYPGDAWLQYEFTDPTSIKGYAVIQDKTTALNSRPTTWELLASDDGEEWTTIDIQSNVESYNLNNYMTYVELGKDGRHYDFAKAADDIHNVLIKNFLRSWGNGSYLINSWHEDPSKINTGYNYWWMAHAIDAYTDAYQRTKSRKYSNYANAIRTGMYTAYDAGRQDLWNHFYDDMEWMQLACLRAYETYSNSTRWFDEAKQLMDWIWEGWNEDDGSEGGIRWNHGDDGRGKNSCSNGPALIGMARLYQMTGDEQYLTKAHMICDWMMTHSRFDDGFVKDSPTNDNRGWTFSYNQGTWVGGLLEMYKITGDEKYRSIAVDLMDKCLFSRWYSPDGIMHEQGPGDGGLFKGIYIRYITNWVLSGKLDPDRQYRYAQYLMENARSLYGSALIKPDMKVMPNWKDRDERVNGGWNGADDGSYHSSIALSGLFLLESADKLRRAGLADEDYNVLNPAADKAWKYYRIKFNDINGDTGNVQISGVELYTDGTAAVETVGSDNASVRISAGEGCVLVSGVEGMAYAEIFNTVGAKVAEASFEDSSSIDCSPGFYIVRVSSSKGTATAKIRI